MQAKWQRLSAAKSNLDKLLPTISFKKTKDLLGIFKLFPSSKFRQQNFVDKNPIRQSRLICSGNVTK